MSLQSELSFVAQIEKLLSFCKWKSKSNVYQKAKSSWHTKIQVTRLATVTVSGGLSVAGHEAPGPGSESSIQVNLNLKTFQVGTKTQFDQSHCSGSWSIRKARWDSGCDPIIIPDIACCPRVALSSLFIRQELWKSELENQWNRPFLFNFLLSVWHFRVVVAWLGATGEGGKPIIKIRKLNLRLLKMPCTARLRELTFLGLTMPPRMYKIPFFFN